MSNAVSYFIDIPHAVFYGDWQKAIIYFTKYMKFILNRRVSGNIQYEASCISCYCGVDVICTLSSLFLTSLAADLTSQWQLSIEE